MRVKVSQLAQNRHTHMVTAVGWTSSNTLISCGDDKMILEWDLKGQPTTDLLQLDSYVTDMQISQSAGGKARTQSVAVACSDGKLLLLASTGKRVEKVVDAHTGAVTCIRWNHEGTAIVTGGEDGVVKQWSPNGNLRSKLAQAEHCVYGVVWAPDNEAVLFCSGSTICIKPLQVTAKPIKWIAHEGLVLKVDWNPVNNLIVSGGEDCKYKVWDSYGRQLFASRAGEYPITSVAWSPNGSVFAVGAFNYMTLCDKNGWSYSRVRTDSGSVLNIDWTSDGTQLAAAGANGAVCFGTLVDRRVEWNNYEALLNENNQLTVTDVLNEAQVKEELEFADTVVDLSLGAHHLIVVTTKSCYLYPLANMGSPHVFDIKSTVSLILQTQHCFLLVDAAYGVTVYSYEGRVLSTPRLPSLRANMLTTANISLSADTVAIIDRAKPTQVHFMDVSSGKPSAEQLTHNLEVVHIGLSHDGLVSDRKLAFVDANRDLFLYLPHLRGKETFKLASMVDTFLWHDQHGILSAVSDGKLLIWYYPNVVSVDKDLLPLTRTSVDASSFGKGCECVHFCGSRLTIRRANGSLQTVLSSPFPSKLYHYTEQGKWLNAVRLCRLAKEPVMWACLAVMSIASQQLETAEIAFAAIQEVDKLEYIQSIMEIPSAEARTAELALYRRRPDDAEAVLLQANLIYRAIKLNIRLYRWQRALELAMAHKQYVDLVLAYRSKYLQSAGRAETHKLFLQVATQVQFEWNNVLAQEEQQLLHEKQTGAALHRALPSPMHSFGGGGAGGFDTEEKASLALQLQRAPSQSFAFPSGGGGGAGGFHQAGGLAPSGSQHSSFFQQQQQQQQPQLSHFSPFQQLRVEEPLAAADDFVMVDNNAGGDHDHDQTDF